MIMNFKWLSHNVFSLSKESISHFKHYCFKPYLPLSFDYSFGTIHHLSCSAEFSYHFVILRILQYGKWGLFLWNFNTASFQQFSCHTFISLFQCKARCYEPDLPFQVVWTGDKGILQKILTSLVIIQSLVSLGCFNIHFPNEFFGTIR